MPMIQQIDAGALLNAFRQGRTDRSAMDATRAKQEREKSIRDTLGQLFTGTTQGGGVAGNYAPSNIVATPAQEAETARMRETFPGAPQYADDRQPHTFNEAFAPGFDQQPAPPPTAAPEMPRRTPNPDVLAKLIALDPEMGSNIVSGLKTMDDIAVKRAEAKNTMMSAAAHMLAKYPPAERASALQSILPQLREAGFSDQEIAGADLSNRGLQMIMATGIDLDKMIDNELAEREFQAGKSVAVAPGGNVAIVKPDGSASWAIGGGGGASTSLPRVNSPEEARRLPPGSRFIDPNGTIRTVPGGQTGSAPSGNFLPGQ